MLPKIFNPIDLQKAPEKPSRWPKFIIKVCFLGIFVFALIYWLFYSSVFTIKNIIVEKDLPTSIEGSLDKFKGQNIFFVKSADIRSELLDEFPDLVNIEVMRGLPDSIRISYAERSPRLVWQTQNRYFLLDENGVLFREIQGGSDLPVVKDNNDLPVEMGKQVVTIAFISFTNNLKSKLPDTGIMLDHFEINETTFQLDAMTKEFLKLKFDTTRTVDSQVSNLKSFLQAHPNEAEDYIDLRVDGKVFYK